MGRSRMKLFNFERLIKKYNTAFTLQRWVPGIGEYDEDLGKYAGSKPHHTEAEPAEGALIPMGQKAVYASGGRLTEADRTLYSLDSMITMKSLITYKELTYSVEAKVSHEQYADFTQYTLKAVDAFYD